METPLNFVHITDTHVGPNRDFFLKGVTPFDPAFRLIHALENLPFTPAFVVHTGDVAADPDENSYRLINELFMPLKIPVYYVAGNHDDSGMIRRILNLGKVDLIDPREDVLSYAFSVGEHRFVTLDAKPDAKPWCGRLPEEQFAFLDRELAAGPKSLTVFLHYPAISPGVPWIDEKMILINGTQLHDRLRTLPAGVVRGVFSGHIHRGISVLKDSILYQSAPSPATQFETWPGSSDLVFAKPPAPTFHTITYANGTTIVQPHALEG